MINSAEKSISGLKNINLYNLYTKQYNVNSFFRGGVMSKDKMVADIIDNIRRVIQVVNEYSKKAERETGLTGPQLWVIKIVAESAPIRVSDLARSMYLHPATVVGILDRLEARGVVKRTRSAEDRRVVEIELTPLGRNIAANAPEVAQGLLVKGLEPLSERKLLGMGNALRQLAMILGAHEIAPKLMLSSETNLPSVKNNGGKAGNAR
jgi:DNA-binding MarR family transcriptional regulator